MKDIILGEKNQSIKYNASSASFKRKKPQRLKNIKWMNFWGKKKKTLTEMQFTYWDVDF